MKTVPDLVILFDNNKTGKVHFESSSLGELKFWTH